MRTAQAILKVGHRPAGANFYENQISLVLNSTSILKPSSNWSPNIFTLVQKVKIGHTKRFNSKDKSRLCRDFAGYFISN